MGPTKEALNIMKVIILLMDKYNYLPFKNVENGTNPMPSFGDGFNVHVTGLTHDERGYPDTNNPETHTDLVERLCNKILKNKDKICSVKSKYCDDADIIVVSYGSPVRSVGTAVEKAREDGYKVGYIKIDTPWPFPDEEIAQLTKNAKHVIVAEMNLGQMFYEVDRVVDCDSHLLGKIGGILHKPAEIIEKIEELGGK